MNEKIQRASKLRFCSYILSLKEIILKSISELHLLTISYISYFKNKHCFQYESIDLQKSKILQIQKFVFMMKLIA